MTTTRNRLPHGAIWQGDGACFRLWAPGARSVDLVLYEAEGRTARHAMEPKDEGWFGCAIEGAAAGALYMYRINDEISVPDPASRFQPAGVHGPSALVDPGAYRWRCKDWRGRPWEEAVLYELHVGTFTDEGSYKGVRDRLQHLVETGITAIELLPLAAFSGQRNWGYDGVLPYAPCAVYGSPEDLKDLIDTAHELGLMVILDVVYNHFGPDGNYLGVYAPQFFDKTHHTPWGAAIDFSRRPVRDYVIQNVLYWLEEYRFDGLRFDAVHAIRDDGPVHVLNEIAQTVQERVGGDRHIHLILENGDNTARYLERDDTGTPRHYTAQWNDDIHHTLHAAMTGEGEGYYEDYTDDPVAMLGRCLARGFAYQGEPSKHLKRPRGEPSGSLPPAAFITFLQNHDQIGNRAFGERILHLASEEAVKAAMAILLLAPSPPMLFMGEEWGAPEPFLFFCDFADQGLAAAVRKGRRQEFSGFSQFRDKQARERIPDPNALSTFQASVLDWTRLDAPGHKAWLDDTRTLLRLRHEHIIPLLSALRTPALNWTKTDPAGLALTWLSGNGARLGLRANVCADPAPLPDRLLDGPILFSTHPETPPPDGQTPAPPWYVEWVLDDRGASHA